VTFGKMSLGDSTYNRAKAHFAPPLPIANPSVRIHLVGQPKLCYSLHHYRVAQVAFAFAGAVLICP
jgi:hypothetical protein